MYIHHYLVNISPIVLFCHEGCLSKEQQRTTAMYNNYSYYYGESEPRTFFLPQLRSHSKELPDERQVWSRLGFLQIINDDRYGWWMITAELSHGIFLAVRSLFTFPTIVHMNVLPVCVYIYIYIWRQLHQVGHWMMPPSEWFKGILVVTNCIDWHYRCFHCYMFFMFEWLLE